MERIFESEQGKTTIFVYRPRKDMNPVLSLVTSNERMDSAFSYSSFGSIDEIDSLIDALQVARQEFANALYAGQEPVEGAPF